MRRPTILIIDDSQAVRLTVSEVLTAAGFDVIEACDGEEGRQTISDRDDLGLILCDVNMPRMDGLSMLELVKTDPSKATLPVLMLTTEGDPGMVRRARNAGARGWIVKPFDRDLLVATVQRLTAIDLPQVAK